MTIDLRDEPFVSLETLMLDRELSGEPSPVVLMTAEQMASVYGELQTLSRFGPSPTIDDDGSLRWSSMTLRVDAHG